VCFYTCSLLYLPAAKNTWRRILMGMLVLVLLHFVRCTAQGIMQYVGIAATNLVLKLICCLTRMRLV
jgi:hypothetical protein